MLRQSNLYYEWSRYARANRLVEGQRHEWARPHKGDIKDEVYMQHDVWNARCNWGFFGRDLTRALEFTERMTTWELASQVWPGEMYHSGG